MKEHPLRHYNWRPLFILLVALLLLLPLLAIPVQGANQNGTKSLQPAMIGDQALPLYASGTDPINYSAAYPFQTIISDTINNATSVFAADLDGDTDIDVLSLSGGSLGEARWYESDGGNPPTFTSHLIDDSGLNGASSVYAADLDQDDDLDILTAAGTSQTINWYKNLDGEGTFSSVNRIAKGVLGAQSAIAADLDNQNGLDVVAAIRFRSTQDVVWYQNDGTGNFTPDVIGSANGATSVDVAKIDNNNNLDVVAVSSGGGNRKVTWYQGDGTGSFTTQAAIYDEPSALSNDALYAGNFDGDSDTDIVVAFFADDKIILFKNNGDGSFDAGTIIDNTANRPRDVHGVDLDGDGDLDILAALQTANQNQVVWYENDGSGNFTKKYMGGDAEGVQSVYAAEIDTDDLIDVLSASFGDAKIAWYKNEGGQFALPTTDIVLTDTEPLTGVMSSGVENQALKIVATHRGHSAAERNARLETLKLRFDNIDDSPLSQSDGTALIEELIVYLDDGSGSFEAGTDTQVVNEPLFLSTGIHTVEFVPTDPDIEFGFNAPKTYFVVLKLTANAHQQSPNTFKITHLTDNESGSSAVDDQGTALKLEYAINVTTKDILAVERTPSTTTINSPTPSQSVVGQSVQIDVTVTGGGETPTGQVTVSADTGESCDATITLASGTGSCNIILNNAGTRTLTANYGGDNTYSTSEGTLSYTVNPADTTTQLSVSAATSVFGENITLTANLSVTSPGAGTPTGNVTFKDNGTPIGTGELNSGEATLTINELTVGAHSQITAEYNTDGNFNGSTSSAISHTVSKADSSTTLTSSSNPSSEGFDVTFTANVQASAPSSGIPDDGTVTFKEGDNILQTVDLQNGEATFTTSSLTVGTHSITAEYGNSSSFNDSTSNTILQEVIAATPTPTPSPTPTNTATSTSIPGSSPTPSNTPGSSPTPTSTPTSDQTPGDVNCNTTATSVDALFILQHVVGLRDASNQCPLPANTLNVSSCDVNGNQTCTSVDALFILQCVVGISNAFCPSALTSDSLALRSHQAVQEEGNASVEIGTFETAPGGIVEAPLTANVPVDTPLGSATINVVFDPSVVQVNSCADGGQMDTELCNFNNTTGLLTYTGLSLGGQSGDFTLATISFEGLSAGQTTLDIQITEFVDAANGTNITVSDLDGQITVVDSTPTPTASNTPIVTNTATNIVISTNTPTASNTPAASNTPTVSNTPAASNTPTVSNTPTNTPTPNCLTLPQTLHEPLSDSTSAIQVIDAGNATVELDTYSISPSQIVDAPLTANVPVDTPLGSATINVAFDPSVVQVNSCADGGQMDTELCNFNNTTGLLTYTALSLGGQSGGFTLATISFEGLSTGQSALDVQITEFVDAANGTNITVSDVDGQITVVDSTPTPTASNTPIVTNTATQIIISTNTPVASNTPAPSNTATPSNTPVPSNTATPSNTPVNSPTPTQCPATFTPTATSTSTLTPTATSTSTSTSTPTPTPTATITPGGPTLTSTATITPGEPTLTPTATITPGGPTLTPTATITPGGPTLTPTITPGGGPDYNIYLPVILR